MDTTAPAILDLGIVLLLAAGAGWLARRVGLPAILGYLAVGLAISPFTPGYVADRHQLEVLADVGVVLLLFEVGIEVDLTRLRRQHGALLWVVPLQTVVTTALAGTAWLLAGFAPIPAALLGLCVALSSSIVIVNITRSKRRTTDGPTEEALLGWSVLQDVSGVALAVVLLSLLGRSERPLTVSLLLLGAFVVLVVAVAAVLPRLLRAVRTDHDLFLVVSVASGLAVAGIGSVVFAVPLALAAFVAGLVISESSEASEARRRLLPFRDLFAVLFFVAIGTLIDPALLGGALPWVALIVGLVVACKVAVAWVLVRVARLDASPPHVAIGLGQIGEFSFVLAAALTAAGAIGRDVFVAMLAAVVATIAGSTILVRLVPARAAPAAQGREVRT